MAVVGWRAWSRRELLSSKSDQLPGVPHSSETPHILTFSATVGPACAQVVDELWAVSSDGRITPFHGTFEDYKALLRLGKV